MSLEDVEYVVDGFFALEMLKRRKGVSEAIDVLKKDLREGIKKLKELGLSKDQIVFVVSAVRKIPIDEAIKETSEVLKILEYEKQIYRITRALRIPFKETISMRILPQILFSLEITPEAKVMEAVLKSELGEVRRRHLGEETETIRYDISNIAAL